MERTTCGFVFLVALAVVGGGCAGGGEDPDESGVNCFLSDSIDACFCVPSDTERDEAPVDACSAATVDNSICCASANYPTSGHCECARWGCNTGVGLCSCGYADRGRNLETSCASGAYCCGTALDDGSTEICFCDSTDCTPGSGESSSPDSCGIDTPHCASNQVEVPSCD